MKRSTTLSLISALLLAVACGGDDGLSPEEIPAALVKVDGDEQVGPLEDPLPEPLTVEVQNSDGEPLGGVTVEFEVTSGGGSVAPASATTAINGRALATWTLGRVEPGAIQGVKASVGSLSVDFTATTVTKGCKFPILIDLAVGETTQLDPTEVTGGCLEFGEGEDGDRYRIALVQPSSSEDAGQVIPASLQVLLPGGEPTFPPPPVAASPEPPAWEDFLGSVDPELAEELRIAEATERFHAELREWERELYARLGPITPRSPLRKSSELRPGPARAPAKRTLHGGFNCAANAATALLLGENDLMAIYQDSAQHESQPVSQARVNAILNYYALNGQRVIDSYFGGTTDINGDGQIVAFITSVGQGIAAYVTARDWLPKSQCDGSNEMEIFYLARGVAQTNPQVFATTVHEVKHISSFSTRVYEGGRHPLWIEEGTAEIAGELSARFAWARQGGPAFGSPVRGEDFARSGRSDSNFGIYLRMVRMLGSIAYHPNALTTNPAGSSGGHTVYGTGWHFFRFLADAHEDAASMADTTFFTAQNTASTTGVGWLRNHFGTSFHSLVEHMHIAMIFSDTETSHPHWSFATYDFPSVSNACVLNIRPAGFYPWPVTTAGNEGQCGDDEVSTPSAGLSTPRTFSGEVGPSGARIHDFVFRRGAGPESRIYIEMEAPAKVLIVRIR